MTLCCSDQSPAVDYFIYLLYLEVLDSTGAKEGQQGSRVAHPTSVKIPNM